MSAPFGHTIVSPWTHAPWPMLRRSTSGLVNHRPITWGRDRLSCLAGRFQPCFLGKLQLSQRLLGCLAERGAGLQVRNIGNISAILIAIEDVDMVVAHGSSS